MALTDALGNLVRFVLPPGQRFDTVGVPPRFEGLAFDALIAYKAFDSNAIIADLDTRGAKVVISQHSRRAKPLAIDEEPAVGVSTTPAGFASPACVGGVCNTDGPIRNRIGAISALRNDVGVSRPRDVS